MKQYVRRVMTAPQRTRAHGDELARLRDQVAELRETVEQLQTRLRDEQRQVIVDTARSIDALTSRVDRLEASE